MIALAAIPIMALLGHIRGQWNERLPLFHPRFWVLPFVFALAWALLPWQQAAIFAACWLLMNWPAHGRWFDMDNANKQVRKPPNWFERLIERVPGNDAVHFTVRNVILALPLMLLSPLLMFLGPLQVGAYWLGWKWLKPTQGNQPAEWLTGALWGAGLAIYAIFIWNEFTPQPFGSFPIGLLGFLS